MACKKISFQLPGFCIFLVTLVFFVRGTVVADDWTLPRNNANLTNSTSEPLSLPLALSWQYSAGPAVGNTSQPVVLGNTVVFAVGYRVIAVDASTGAFKWAYPSTEEPLGSQIKTSLASYDGKIYFGANDGSLYCLAAGDGHLHWTYAALSPIRSSPMISDGRVYVGSDDNSLHALDAETGEPIDKWPFVTRDDITTPAAVAKGLVYFVSRDTNLYAANAMSGRFRWAVRLSVPTLDVLPIVDNENVYLAAGNLLMAISAMGGQRRWAIAFPTDISSPPALQNDQLFVTTRNRKLYAISTKGKQRWAGSADTLNSTRTSPMVAGNYVVVAADKGLISIFDIETGMLKWRYIAQPNQSSDQNVTAKNNNIGVSPIYANGTLYILADDGTLSAFRSDAVDMIAPAVSTQTPVPGSAVSGSPPLTLSAVVTDIGSGIDEASIGFSLDGEAVEYVFAPSTGLVSYVTPFSQTQLPLKDGKHEVVLVAKDSKGNQVRSAWTFAVDNSLPKPRVHVPVVKSKTPKPPTTSSPSEVTEQHPQNLPGDAGGMTPPPPPPMPEGGVTF